MAAPAVVPATVGAWSFEIPSDSEIMRTYDVARETARRAVAIVREAGCVETKPQRDTFVLARDKDTES
jgi:DNA-binding GntR family transcriptional regulator